MAGETVKLTILLLAAVPVFGAAPALKFEEHLIASGLKGGYQVVPADVNHDGKIDLIAVASGMTDLVWYENPAWERHVIASNLPRMINVAAWDVDGDGIPEIAIAYEFSNNAKNSLGIVAILHHGGDPRKPWTLREIDRIPTSHRLRFVDIDGSGKKVLVNAPLTGAASQPPDYRQHVPLVYYRPGEWKREAIGEENEGVVHGITVTNLTGGSRDELLTASFLGIHLYGLTGGKWKRTQIAGGDPAPWPKSGSSDTAVGHIGKTRFIAAIEPWHGNQVVVYRKSGLVWKREVIDDSLVDGHTIVTGEFEGRGSSQIIAGFRGEPHRVYLYSFDGKRWNRRTLDDGGMGAAACAVADLNGDGRLDVACIGSATQNLKWYERKW